MAGRKRKAGPRYPSGDLKKPTGDPIAPAAWARVRSDVAKIANDPRLSSEVGRLSFHREITDAQAAAAFKVRDIYAAFEQAKGKHRSSASPDNEPVFKGDGGFPEPIIPIEDIERLDPSDPLRVRMEKTRAAYLAFKALQEELTGYGAMARDLLETLCVDNRSIPYMQLGYMRWLLERLSRFFGVTGHKKGGSVGKIARQMSAPSARKPKAKRKDTGIRTVLRHARPDLDDKQLDEAERMAMAVRDRDAYRRQKA